MEDHLCWSPRLCDTQMVLLGVERGQGLEGRGKQMGVSLVVEAKGIRSSWEDSQVSGSVINQEESVSFCVLLRGSLRALRNPSQHAF